MDYSSPFPGMDPYTEARNLWKGIHTQLIGELSTHLLPPLLAPAYVVDVEPSLQVRQEGTMDEEDESAIYIREANHERLVTVIEILSYSNKTGGSDKRGRYLHKRQALLESGVHLVEVDLLRWGRRVIETLPGRSYHILVSRAVEPHETRVWSFDMTDPIPDTPLPLTGADEYVPLPVQKAYRTIFEARHFRARLDYSQDPPPSLTPGEHQFIQECLSRAGLR